jgi:hypothetical protein
MSNSVFIQPDDTFDVVVNWKQDGRKVKILTEPEKDAAGKVLSKSLKVTFRYPDFATSQQVLKSATTLDQNGMPSLNFLSLQTSLLYGLAKSWDLVDEASKPVTLDAAAISKLRVDIAKDLIAKIYAELGDGGLI